MHLLTAPGTMGVPAGTVVKNPPASAGDTRGAGSIPGSWRSPGGGSGNLPQYSYLENSRDRGVWRVTMGPQRVRHNWAHTHTHTHTRWNCELPDFYLRMTMPFYCLKSMHSFWNASRVQFSLLASERIVWQSHPNLLQQTFLSFYLASICTSEIRNFTLTWWTTCLLCNPTDYTVHEILQARILEWVAFSFSRGSSQPRDWAKVFLIAGRFFMNWATTS